ncbi:MAG: hypothetical protein GTO29_08335 [Candidatus Latescibacteria bacterium]|nr:hypothetical protein [Candidatus Latescibacterota bacterium]NIO56170.1 hypothetical protein [Candidatus Latescibacterota bacterium]
MAEHYFVVRVECYAGYRGEEEPRRFTWGKRELEVVEILDRWLDPNHRYFKTRADDEGIYILRHDVNAGVWEISVYLNGRYRSPHPSGGTPDSEE